MSSGGGAGGRRTWRSKSDARRSRTTSSESPSGSVYVCAGEEAAGVKSSLARIAALVTARAYAVSYATVVTITDSAMMRRSSRRSCVRDGVNAVMIGKRKRELMTVR